MTLVGNIIEEAFREASLVTELQHPTPSQTEQAVERLQNIISQVYSFEGGEPLVEVRIGDEGVNIQPPLFEMNECIPSNSRVFLNHDSAKTLYLPQHPRDGARFQVIDVNSVLATSNVTINGNGKRIETAATLTLNTNALNRTWRYDAEVGNWVRITSIDLSSEMPFIAEYDDYFITTLACKLSSKYQAGLSPFTLREMEKQLSRMRAKFRQSTQMPSEFALRISPYNNWGWYETDFDRGF